MEGGGAPRALGRDFWFYFGGQLISQVGSAFTAFALPLIVFQLTHSATNLALTTVSEYVPYLLFGLVLGAVVDRLDRRRMMLLTDVARGLVILVLPVLASTGELRVYVIYMVGFVQSCLGILFTCGEFAAVPSLVGRDDLVRANARTMATNSSGQVLGPLLAGALVSWLSPTALLYVDAGSFVVSAVALSVIRGSFNASNGATAPTSMRREVVEGLRYVLSHPVLRSISLMMALINFVAASEGTQLVLFAKRVLRATNSEVAVLFAAGAAGIVLVSLAAGAIRQRLSFAVTALGSLALSGLCVVGMAWFHRYPVALVLWGVSSGFGLLLNINTGALRQAIVPPHLYGRVISIAGVLAWSAIPLGSLLGAYLIGRWGVSPVYALSGAATTGIALLFALSPVRQGDHYLAAAEEGPTEATLSC
jgi:predicted MFS family arabinose efflux permease